MKIVRGTPLVFMALVLLVYSSASADIFLKQKVHSDADSASGLLMGVTPASDYIQSVWISTDKIRIDNADQTTLYLLDRNVRYVIDHTQKTYFEMSIKRTTKSGEVDVEAKGDKVTVTPTGESKIIGKWKCKKYIQNIQGQYAQTKDEIWATENIKINAAQYMKYYTKGMGKTDEDAMQEFKKVKGVAVLTTSTTTVMGGTKSKISTELLECREGTAPAGHFELPAGYKNLMEQ